MSNAFTEAFGAARATKAQIEQNREDKNHLLAGFVEDLIESAAFAGLSILFTGNASLGEKQRARTLQSADWCDTYYGWVRPLALEGADEERWSNADTVPDYAPHVNIYLNYDGICVAEFSGGFIGTAVGRERIFSMTKKVSVPPLTYAVGGYAGAAPGVSPVTMRQLARCLAARLVGLSDVEAEVHGILHSRR